MKSLQEANPVPVHHLIVTELSSIHFKNVTTAYAYHCEQSIKIHTVPVKISLTWVESLQTRCFVCHHEFRTVVQSGRVELVKTHGCQPIPLFAILLRMSDQLTL